MLQGYNFKLKVTPMFIKKNSALSIICCLLLSSTVSAWRFPVPRCSAILKALTQNFCNNKKILIATGDTSVLATLAYKRPSIIQKSFESVLSTCNSVFKAINNLFVRQKMNIVPAVQICDGATQGMAHDMPLVPKKSEDKKVEQPMLTDDEKKHELPVAPPVAQPVVKVDQPQIALHEHISAAMLAAGAGDAMGRPTEFIASIEEIYAQYPHGIHSLADLREHNDLVEKNGKMIAPYTDDTRMAMLVMEESIQARRWAMQQGIVQGQTASHYINDHFDDVCNRIMTRIAVSFIKDREDSDWGWTSFLRAPGGACQRGVQEQVGTLHKNQLLNDLPDDVSRYPLHWWRLENHEGGCGSVMRAYPFGLVFSDDPELAARLAAEHSRITHGEPFAVAACAAMAAGTACALQNMPPYKVLQTMIQAAQRYEFASQDQHVQQPGIDTTTELLQQAIAWAQDANVKSDDVFNRFRGWNAREAIAAVAYIFAVSPDNVQNAIALGVHTPGDSDSIASLAGALVGARVGMRQIPDEWKQVLEDADQLVGYGRQATLLAT